MNLTDEQEEIINHEGNTVISAVAGSGKTSTLREYCKRRRNRKILYLVYNKAMREEATRKFMEAGLSNVDIQTTHSLAYRNYNVRSKFKLHDKGNYRTMDMVERPEIAGKGRGETTLALAHHSLAFLNYFCNSDVAKMEELDYEAVVKDPQAKTFVKTHLGTIRSAAYGLLKDMYQKKAPMTHDGYLKLYQLSKPELSYDHILVDEAQDCSSVTLDIVMNQEWAMKGIVGDGSQQLYAFRHAVNTLDKVDYQKFTLSNSFRFDQQIADLAMKSLRLKNILGLPGWDVQVNGLGGKIQSGGQRAVLSRGNLALITRAIEDMLANNYRHPYFEGGFQNYTLLAEGGSLFDILNLYLGRPNSIRDELIKSFSHFEELLQYQKETDDRELQLMTEVVSKYGAELFGYIRMLRENQVPNKVDADVIFSTVHRAKGQEYPTVSLCDDFITADRISVLMKKASAPPAKGEKPYVLDLSQLNEEINILYVGITRAQSTISMPFSIDEVRPDWRK